MKFFIEYEYFVPFLKFARLTEGTVISLSSSRILEYILNNMPICVILRKRSMLVDTVFWKCPQAQGKLFLSCL